MIKAIIYDLDDLMVDSTPLHLHAWEMALKKFGKSFKDMPLEKREKFPGMRVIDILQKIKNSFNLKIDDDVFLAAMEKFFLKLVKKKLKLMPGFRQSLKLFKAKQLKIGLASSGTKKYINLVLRKFNLKDSFDAVVTGDDVKKGKPDAEIYLKTANKLKIKPSECLVLEDSFTGVRAAKRAGCYCLAVDNINTPPQNLTQADIVLNSLSEINLEIVASLK